MVITELLQKTAKATRVAHVLTTNVIRVLIKVDRFAMAQAKKTPKRVLPAITEDPPTHALPETICQEVLVRKFFLSINYVLALFFFSHLFCLFFSFAVVDLTQKTEITTKKTHKVALGARHVQLEPTMRAPHALE